MWNGLVRIEKVVWATGKIRYRIDAWDHLHGGTYQWMVNRWCNWFIPAVIYAHLLHGHLYKQRAKHGDPISNKTIIS